MLDQSANQLLCWFCEKDLHQPVRIQLNPLRGIMPMHAKCVRSMVSGGAKGITLFVEEYRSLQPPGLDCPMCLVDTGDSYHYVDCLIGKALGQATRAE